MGNSNVMNQMLLIEVERIMKFIITATLATLLLGCNSQTPPFKPFVVHGDTLGWSDSLYIHFQDGFYSDSLTVLVNDDTYATFNDLTTNENWSLADGIVIPMESIKYVTVLLHRTTGTDSITLELPMNNFIGLSNNSRTGWTVTTSKKPFIYE